MADDTNGLAENEGKSVNTKPKCGIVMPIGTIDDCLPDHWSEVLSILKDAIKSAGFESELVSVAEDSGVIHKRIVHNLYHNELVVCDVSARNPNVMFELGMRLAFDKPTIIIKDDRTKITFDAGGIEHIGYPRDLRFLHIVDFKKRLCDRLKGTHEKALNDPTYTTFLKHFGEFTVAKIDTKVVPESEYIMKGLQELRREIHQLALVVSMNAERKDHVALDPAPSTLALSRMIRHHVQDNGLPRGLGGVGSGDEGPSSYEAFSEYCESLSRSLHVPMSDRLSQLAFAEVERYNQSND